ncbi:MAG: hypothetical protein IPL19_18695 [Sandaracinaceae bacterium]|nr:hypothetical protein [Sandaracinaceae bacterium]
MAMYGSGVWDDAYCVAQDAPNCVNVGFGVTACNWLGTDVPASSFPYVCEGTACGNGRVNGTIGEECDDGDLGNGDGCSSTCTVEPGWVCEPGNPLNLP